MLKLQECESIFGFNVNYINDLLIRLIQHQKNYYKITEEFLACNYRLVYYIANNDAKNSSNVNDLLVKAIVGLHKAIERYKICSDNKFVTYAAYWAKQKSAKAKHESLECAIPGHSSDISLKIRYARKYLSNILGREPDYDEISRFTGYTLLQIHHHDRSLTKPRNLTQKMDSKDNNSSLMHEIVTNQQHGLILMEDDSLSDDLRYSVNSFMSSSTSSRNQEIFLSKNSFSRPIRSFETSFLIGLKERDEKVFDHDGKEVELTEKNFQKIFNLYNEEKLKDNSSEQFNTKIKKFLQNNNSSFKGVTDERLRQIFSLINQRLGFHTEESLEIP